MGGFSGQVDLTPSDFKQLSHMLPPREKFSSLCIYSWPPTFSLVRDFCIIYSQEGLGPIPLFSKHTKKNI